jgi:hypothetical protein
LLVTVPSQSTVRSASTEITWHAPSRIAFVCYSAGVVLTIKDARFLADALTGWVGAGGEPFAVLADGARLGGTDGEYRAEASRFFRKHRDHAFIALIHLGPLIQVVVEMFRVGTGIPLKTFADETAARAWLRTKGVAA